MDVGFLAPAATLTPPQRRLSTLDLLPQRTALPFSYFGERAATGGDGYQSLRAAPSVLVSEVQQELGEVVLPCIAVVVFLIRISDLGLVFGGLHGN